MHAQLIRAGRVIPYSIIVSGHALQVVGGQFHSFRVKVEVVEVFGVSARVVGFARYCEAQAFSTYREQHRPADGNYLLRRGQPQQIHGVAVVPYYRCLVGATFYGA